MTLLEWREEFSVGVPAVDHEHRLLLGLVNEIHQHLTVGEHLEDPEGALGELYAEINAHFALEEKGMREQGYARYRQHKEDHQRLLDEIRDLMDLYAGGILGDEGPFAARLAHWFAHHFQHEDALLHRPTVGDPS
jgi:hemerythrin-like metal-binding protein